MFHTSIKENCDDYPERPSTRAASLEMILTLLAGGCTGLMSLGVACAATPDGDVPRVVVNYAGLNLSTDRGAKDLFARLQHAADAVCPSPWIRDLAGKALARSCREQAIARAVRAIDDPRFAGVLATLGHPLVSVPTM